MVSTVNQSDQGAAPKAAHGGVRSRVVGLILILGAVVYGTNVLIFNQVVFRIAYGGPPGLVTLLESPLWIPFRAMGVVGVLVIAVGLTLLLDRYSPQEQWGLRTIVLGSLGISVVLFLVEFAIAAQASPNILGGEGGRGITQSQADIILTAYQGIGVGVLILAILFLGITLALVGLLLVRVEYHSRTLATVGIVVGIVNALFGMVAFLGVVEPGFPDLGSQVLTGGWILLIGVAELRRSVRQN